MMIDTARLEIRIMTLEQQVKSLMEADQEVRIKAMQHELELLFKRLNKKSFDLELFLRHFEIEMAKNKYPS